MDKATKERYQQWLKAETLEDGLRKELEAMDDEKQVTDAFYKDLEFGTGGIRGIIGVGSARINVHTVERTTQGYAEYLNSHHRAPAVAIARDSRLNGLLYSEAAAKVLAANGIKVWMFPEPCPSPVLAYAVRYLGCSGGIIITASHNPSQYNGYKVDSPEGGSISVQTAEEISRHIAKTDIFKGIKRMTLDEASPEGLFKYIGDDVAASYLKTVSKESLLHDGDGDKDLRIIYTPLNGTGLEYVTRCLDLNGYKAIRVVEEQAEPDGNFPTCPYPNPEKREALEMGLRDLKTYNGDLLLATDPDSDRIGAAVRDGDGFRLFTGNEIGVLLLDYIAKRRIALETFPEQPVAVKSIVSTDMAFKVADEYGIELREVPTGSKYIGEQIQRLEAEGHPERFLLGFEESYGYLIGTYIQDKDGVNGALAIADMAAFYKKQGKSLLDVMNELYGRHGRRIDTLYSFAFPGAEGMERMKTIMSEARKSLPARLCGEKVVTVKDFLFPPSMTDGSTLTAPKSDMLKLITASGTSVILRPSGTEPKLKLYLSVTGSHEQEQRLKKEIVSLFSLGS